MSPKIIVFILIPIMILPAYGYHEELEKKEREKHPISGLFNDMNPVFFPRVDNEYRLQIVVDSQSYENSTITVGYRFDNIEYTPSKLEPGKKFFGFEKTRIIQGKGDSKEVQVENKFPMLINFTSVSFDKPGVYRYSFFDRMEGPKQSTGSSGGGVIVVSKYGKAVNENGDCKNQDLTGLPKYDYSTLVCIKQKTAHELITRGWAPLPG